MRNKRMRKVCLILTLMMTLIFGSSMNAYAYVEDSSANEENTVETAAVVMEEEIKKTQAAEKAEGTSEESEAEGGAFSESGNLTLTDDVSKEVSKDLEYMTVKTKNGAMFYLVIDHSTDTDNVYFLNQVDAADLMAIMDDSEKQAYENSQKEEVNEPVLDIQEESVIMEEEEPKEEDVSLTGINSAALIGILAVTGVAAIGGYTFLKKKKKQDGSNLEDDLEFYDDEEYENEDEEVILTDEEEMES